MNITIDKAVDAVANEEVMQRVFLDQKDKRYCAKCKTELTWYYAENSNYIFFCKNCESKIIVKAPSLYLAVDKIGVKN